MLTTLNIVLKQSAMDTGSGFLRIWYANLLIPGIVFDMRTVVGILAFGRHITCVALGFSRRRHPAISHDIPIVVFLSCYFVPGTAQALLFRWHYGVRTMDYFSLLCVVFLRAWYA